jgi:hypothetical protein
VIVREFWLLDGRQDDFEKACSPDGVWAQLLGHSDGYLGSEVRVESQAPLVYRVFDYGRTHWDFEAFRFKYQREYEEFNRLLSEELVRRQVFIGSFYEDDPYTDLEDGTDLVPS